MMPIFKHKNTDFFKKWSPEMAYVLGFFAADGNMIINKREGKYLEFTSTDKEILEKIKMVIASSNKISSRTRKTWKKSYRLQIGSREMFDDLTVLGLSPNKSKTLNLPEIPSDLFSHFLRGYFDGDGSISVGKYKKQNRSKPSFIALTRFTSGSYFFLKKIQAKLKEQINISGSLFSNSGTSWQLSYSIRDTRKLFDFMYGGEYNNLYLSRKYDTFKKFRDAVVA